MRTWRPAASVTGRPEAWISCASCRPEAEPPTTSTPAGGQVARPPVAERVHLDDAARKPAAKAGPARAVAGAGRHHDGAGAPGAGVGLDAVAAAMAVTARTGVWARTGAAEAAA